MKHQLTKLTVISEGPAGMGSAGALFIINVMVEMLHCVQHDRLKVQHDNEDLLT